MVAGIARLTFVRRLRTPVAIAGGSALALAGYTRGAADEFRAIPEAALPLTYDPAAIDAFWSQHTRCALARLGQISSRVLPFAARLLGDVAGSR